MADNRPAHRSGHACHLLTARVETAEAGSISSATSLHPTPCVKQHTATAITLPPARTCCAQPSLLLRPSAVAALLFSGGRTGTSTNAWPRKKSVS